MTANPLWPVVLGESSRLPSEDSAEPRNPEFHGKDGVVRNGRARQFLKASFSLSGSTLSMGMPSACGEPARGLIARQFHLAAWPLGAYASESVVLLRRLLL